MSSMSSFRGGYAPRRGRGGWNKSSFSKPQKRGVEPDIVKNPLGELLETVSISDLKLESNVSNTQGAIFDLKYVASYNWRNDATPTILVPGKSSLNMFQVTQLMICRQASTVDAAEGGTSTQ